MLRAEMGAGAAFSGITSRSWPSERGLLDPAGPMSLVTTGVGPYQVETALVVLENTHNFGGGTVQPIEAIREVRTATAAVGVAMHLDGARLWNAHVASRGRAARLRHPVRHRERLPVQGPRRAGRLGARRLGRADGGGAGLAQALRRRACARSASSPPPGLHALDHHIERLADDHARAARFAAACARGGARQPSTPATVETNIVVLDVGAVGWAAPEFVAALLEQGVRTYAVGPGRVRAVWHLDVDDAGTDAARRRRDRAAALARRLRPHARLAQPGVTPVSTLRMLPSGSSNQTPRASPPIDATPSSQLMPGASKVWNVTPLSRSAAISASKPAPATWNDIAVALLVPANDDG